MTCETKPEPPDPLHVTISRGLVEGFAALCELVSSATAGEAVICISKVSSLDHVPDRLVLAGLVIPRGELSKLTTRAESVLRTFDDFRKQGGRPLIVQIVDGTNERTLVANLAEYAAAQSPPTERRA